MIHALLVIAVAVVPPGVRGTCAGCPLPGGLHACCAGPRAVAAPARAAAAVAATHCCGSHASADPGTPTDASSAARVSETSVADAADGGPHSRGGCGCWLAARDHSAAWSGPHPVASDEAAPLVATAEEVVIPKTTAVATDASSLAPPRPVRVRLCVWRN